MLLNISYGIHTYTADRKITEWVNATPRTKTRELLEPTLAGAVRLFPSTSHGFGIRKFNQLVCETQDDMDNIDHYRRALDALNRQNVLPTDILSEVKKLLKQYEVDDAE
jgi:hypothetical protein